MTTRLDQIMLFNAAAPERRAETGGLLLPRIPEAVRKSLSPRGKFVGMRSTGVELRFVTPANDIFVTLSALHVESRVTVYRGCFEHLAVTLRAGEVKTMHLESPAYFKLVDLEKLDTSRFSPHVWRIVIESGPVAFHGLDALGAEVRKPRAEELPGQRWLAYGSSITNANTRGYVHRAADELGVDVLNKGLGGACRIEPELVDYLAELDWDFATCELGVNMRGDTEPAVFRERVNYLLDRFKGSHPGKPVGLITPFPNAHNFLNHQQGELDGVNRRIASRQAAFGEALVEIAESRQADHVFLIRGDAVLDRMTGMHADLLHPADDGHIRMGRNLAELLGKASV